MDFFGKDWIIVGFGLYLFIVNGEFCYETNWY